jgi:hypothetical protein
MKVRVALALSLSVCTAACGHDATEPLQAALRVAQSAAIPTASDSEVVGTLPDISLINSRLAARGINARLNAIQLMVTHDYPPGAPTVYHDDRTKYLPAQFVAVDPRRREGTGLEWTYDTRYGDAFTRVNGVEAPWTASRSVEVARADVNTWVGTRCFKAPFDQLPYPVSPNNQNIEFMDDYFFGPEAQPFQPVAEITFGGFLPPSVFALMFSTNGAFVSGVTFQFVFADGSGAATDIDKNGFTDGAWSEIYFNDGYYWGDAAAPGYSPQDALDLGTIGLHESGHGFGLDHFGRVFQTHGGYQATGHNIMTEAYSIIRSVSGEPTSAFCNLYKTWR